MKSLTFVALLLVSNAATADISGSALIVDADIIAIIGMKIRLGGRHHREKPNLEESRCHMEMWL